MFHTQSIYLVSNKHLLYVQWCVHMDTGVNIVSCVTCFCHTCGLDGPIPLDLFRALLRETDYTRAIICYIWICGETS